MNSVLAINTPQVISEIFDDEAIVAHLANGVYYHLKGSGVPIWQWVVQGLPEAQIEAVARDTFNEPDMAAIQTFLKELETEALLKRAQSGQPASIQVPEPVAFSVPVMERFTDMQELLLLDPIHEVGEEGWPHKNS